MRLCTFLGLLALMSVVVCGLPSIHPNDTSSSCQIPAPVHGKTYSDGTRFEYVVRFHGNHTLLQNILQTGINVTAFPNFLAIDGPPGYIAPVEDDIPHRVIRLDPGVLEIQREQMFSLQPPKFSPTRSPDWSNFTNMSALHKRDYGRVERPHATWGLRMISAEGSLSTPVDDHGPYEYLADAGKGVDIYIFDTGIYLEHDKSADAPPISEVLHPVI